MSFDNSVKCKVVGSRERRITWHWVKGFFPKSGLMKKKAEKGE
jgi:hypothetical protein